MKISNSEKTAIFIFLAITFIFLHPLFKNIRYLGVQDWDYTEYTYALTRETILRYHQLPLWSPYLCGGYPLLGDPLSLILSPFVIFPLVFGPIIGIKINIFIFLFIGLYGMWKLSKHLGLRGVPSYLPSFIFMLSSIYPLSMVGGNFPFKTMGLMPWAVLFYLKADGLKPKHTVFTSVVLALMFFEGAVYIFLYTILFLFLLTLLLIVKNKETKKVRVLILVLILTLSLSSVKLLPVLEIYQRNPRITENMGGYTVNVLHEALLSRDQMHFNDHGIPYYEDHDNPTARSPLFGSRAYGWDENGAYVGVIPLTLFLVGSIVLFRKNWLWSILAFIFIWLSFGGRIPVSLWDVLHIYPPFSSLRVPTRFRVYFVFCLAVVAGKTLNELSTKLSRRVKSPHAANLLVFIVLLDLLWINSVIFNEAFTIKPPTWERNEEFEQSAVNPQPPKAHDGTYLSVLENTGNVNCQFKGDSVGITPHATPKESSEYTGEIFLENTTGRVDITYFSPNKIQAHVKSDGYGLIILNQNYYKGWKVRGLVNASVNSHNGLASAPTTPGEHNITFYYLPNSFIAGLFLTIISSIFAIRFILKSSMNDKH